MTHEALANTIRSRFETQIAEAYNLPTQYDNQDFNKPADGSMWCRVSVKEGDSFQVDIGGSSGSRDRTAGVVFVQIFIALGQGDKQAVEMADLIKAVFRRITISGVKFRTPSVKRVGNNNQEWQVNVICPFIADDIS